MSETEDAAALRFDQSKQFVAQAQQSAANGVARQQHTDLAVVHAQWAVYLQLRAMTEELRAFRTTPG